MMKTLLQFSAMTVWLVFAIGCNAFGTGTGNPFTQQNGSTSFFSAAAVADEACTATIRCHPAAQFNDCHLSSRLLTTFSGRLGLPDDPLLTVLDIENLERTGKIKVKPSALQICQLAIRGLDCTSAPAQAAFKPGTANPFSELADVLNDDCLDIFDEP